MQRVYLLVANAMPPVQTALHVLPTLSYMEDNVFDAMINRLTVWLANPLLYLLLAWGAGQDIISTLITTHVWHVRPIAKFALISTPALLARSHIS